MHYLRLKQLTLGYNFPKEWMKRINLEGCRLFFTAENLFLLTNYSGVDPEVVDPFTGYDNFLNYPLARKLTLGLTVRFSHEENNIYTTFSHCYGDAIAF